MIKTKNVDIKFVNELQRLALETESRRDLIAFMITQNMDISGEKFKSYETEYQKYYLAYQTAKTEFETNVLKPEFGENMVKWNLDFNTSEVTVEMKD